MDGPCLISIGSIGVDHLVRGRRWPGPGQNAPVCDFQVALGGKAATVAFFAGRLGLSSRLVARAGDDRLAATALAALGRAGVDVRFTRLKPAEETGLSMVLIGVDGQVSAATAANANAGWGDEEDEDIETAILSASQGSVVYADLGTSPDGVAHAIDAARRRGLQVIVDATTLGDSRRLLPSADYLVLDARQARRLARISIRGPEDGFEVGRKLRQHGTRCVLVQLDGGGCAVSAEHELYAVHAPFVDPVNRRGATEAFAGALAVGLVHGRPPRECISLAVAASSIAVQRYGGPDRFPTSDELDRFVKCRMPPSETA